MGMTDRQFDSYQAKQVKILKKIVETSSDYEGIKKELEEFIEEIECELKRP